MTLNLILISIFFSIFVILFILYFIKKEKIKIKYALVWLMLFFLLLILLLLPGVLDDLTNFLGFQTPSNMIFSMLISVLVVINISLTGIVSSQDKKIRLLIQEVSILKKVIGDVVEKKCIKK